eukprot:8864756-Pyramimonas_sp.AAC.1
MHNAILFANTFRSLPRDHPCKSAQRHLHNELLDSIPVALQDCHESSFLRLLAAWRPGAAPVVVQQLIRVRYVAEEPQ